MSDLNTTSNHKTEHKNVQNSSYCRKISFPAILKIFAILKTCEKKISILECDKNFFSMNMFDGKIWTQKSKTHWVMAEKPVFQPFWKSLTIWKPVKRTCQIFKKNWRPHFYTKCGKKKKNTLFEIILLFLSI
jgi:hypothetical protein